MLEIGLRRTSDPLDLQGLRQSHAMLTEHSAVACLAFTPIESTDAPTQGSGAPTVRDVACADAAPASSLSPTQTTLLEMWKRMLWLKDIGLNDSFIDLGGNSLSATRCINRIRSIFDVEVPMDAFFLDPADIATIAGLIDESKAGTDA